MPVVFSPNGQLLAAWKANKARIWNSANGAEVLKSTSSRAGSSPCPFRRMDVCSPEAIENVTVKNGQAEFKSEIRVWEVATGAPRTGVPRAHTFGFEPGLCEQRAAIAGSRQSPVRRTRRYASMELANLETGSIGKIVSTEEGGVSSLALSPDRPIAGISDRCRNGKVAGHPQLETLHTFGSQDEAGVNKTSLNRFLVSVKSVPAVAFLPDGKTIAGAIEQGGIKLWDARTGETKRALAVEAETGSVATISRDGGTVAEIINDETVRVWDLASETSKKSARSSPARSVCPRMERCWQSRKRNA